MRSGAPRRTFRNGLATALALVAFLSGGVEALGHASTEVPDSLPGLDLVNVSPVLANLPNSKDVGSRARLAVVAGGRELRLDGEMADGVADRVAALLAAHPGVTRIRLGSDGGLVDEAEALGRLVAAHGLSTYVTRTCASACSLVYVRGHRRFLGPHGRIGFHGPYVTGLLDKTRSVDASSERNAYLRAGLGAGFVARALSVSPEGMWFPDRAGLRAAGVVTDLGGPDPVVRRPAVRAWTALGPLRR